MLPGSHRKIDCANTSAVAVRCCAVDLFMNKQVVGFESREEALGRHSTLACQIAEGDTHVLTLQDSRHYGCISVRDPHRKPVEAIMHSTSSFIAGPCKGFGHSVGVAWPTLVSVKSLEEYADIYACGKDSSSEDRQVRRCDRCLQLAEVPYNICWFCGESPSWHHGRCCFMPRLKGLLGMVYDEAEDFIGFESDDRLALKVREALSDHIR